MGKLISIIEVARRFGMTEQTLRNWIKEGHISFKQVGKARYIDEDTVNALQDTAEEIQLQKAKLDALLAEIHYDTERLEIQREEDKTRRRLLKAIYSNAFRNDFFLVVTNLLHKYGDLKEREAVILSESLSGYTLEEIGMRYGLTRERVRQIAEKAIRKSRDISTIEKYIDERKSLEEKNKRLRGVIVSLKAQLAEQDKPEPTDEEQAETIRLCELFNKKLVDVNLSTRSLNCLKGGDRWRGVPSCDTVGDLCKLTKTQFLKIRNAGKKSLIEIDEFLESNNLSWGMDVDKYYKDYEDIKLDL